MGEFNNNSIASLLFAEKLSFLAHLSVGQRGRRFTNTILGISGLLGYTAGFGGLTSLVGSTAVSIIALAAGLSTTAAIILLTTLKSNDHLRAATAYQDVYLRTVQQGLDDDKLQRLQDEYIKIVEDVNKDGVALSLSTLEKFKGIARAELYGEPELPAIDDRSAIDKAKVLKEQS